MANRNFKPSIKGDAIIVGDNLPIDTLGDVDDYSEKETPKQEEETLKQDDEEEISSEEVSFIEPIVEEIKEKTTLIKVRPKTTHRVSIGGEWYQFVANEITSVPENVRRILIEGNDLLPL